jgi:signal transduction histidine kinase
VLDPFELPVTSTGELFRTGNPQTWGHRLHVRGTVLLQRPGIVFLRDDEGSIVLRSPLLLPTRPGDILDAVGFPVPDAFAPGLDDASFRIHSHGAPPTPVDAAPADILSGRLNANLVRVEGLVLDVVRTHARVTVLLEAKGSILSAVLDSDAPGPLVEGLEVGSRVRIAGVVGPTAAERLILRSSADLNLLATPPFWNPSRARGSLALFALLVCAAFFWALTLRKRVQAQTRTIQERLLERNSLIGELETRNAELERFTYTVSHDLKTPLVTIGGFLGLVEQDALAGNPQRLREDLKRISEATDKMRRLLDELLQLSRAGRRLNTVEALPLRPIIDEALSIVDARSSRVRVDVQSPLPTVLGDRGRLIEVFQNLLENAFKYTGNQEAPTVEIGSDGFDEKGHAKIFVRDNGIGIPPQFHSRIFELFEKLDPLSQGTGVGLALVRRIVDAHGGSVSVQSQGDGTGTTFTLTLPVPSPTRTSP